jgi:hypothetical protein
MRGGRKKIRNIVSTLEAHLDEMLQVPPGQRPEFYTKMANLPEIVAEGLSKEEIVNWYKRLVLYFLQYPRFRSLYIETLRV